MLHGMSYHINDIGFYFLAFLANVQPDHNEHHVWVMVQSAFCLSSLVLYFVVLAVFHVNYTMSLCLNESVLQLFQMKRLIMIFDSLWHLRIAGSAADIATKHSPLQYQLNAKIFSGTNIWFYKKFCRELSARSTPPIFLLDCFTIYGQGISFLFFSFLHHLSIEIIGSIPTKLEISCTTLLSTHFTTMIPEFLSVR